MKLMRYDRKTREIVYEFDVKGGIASGKKTIAVCNDIINGMTVKEICKKHKLAQCQVLEIKRKFLGKGILVK